MNGSSRGLTKRKKTFTFNQVDKVIPIGGIQGIFRFILYTP